MTNKINDGGAAFPCPREGEGTGFHSGMTYRKWLAGLTLQSCITGWPSQSDTEAAEYAIQYADALIAKLEEEQP